MERETSVAGRFYPSEPRRLAEDVARFLAPPSPGPAPAPQRALGLLAPHAGYMFSGRVAGAAWAAVEVPGEVILLCPNHTGMGARVALWPEGGWETPLGTAGLDEPLTAALQASGLCTPDRNAHLAEHAIEVQLPFLLARRPGARIAALCLAHLSFERCLALGRAVAAAARERGALVVASSDMSHYVPAAVARERDRLALDRLLALDARGLHEVVEKEKISMCGFVPATVMLCAAREQGASGAVLTGYATSGDVTGDDRSVVGYAGALVR